MALSVGGVMMVMIEKAWGLLILYTARQRILGYKYALKKDFEERLDPFIHSLHWRAGELFKICPT